MTLPDFDMKSLTAIFVPFVGSLMWVGRLQQRVTNSEKEIDDLNKAKMPERIANIEGKLTLMCSSMERIEKHLLDHAS
jgi:hypothetical protein